MCLFDRSVNWTNRNHFTNWTMKYKYWFENETRNYRLNDAWVSWVNVKTVNQSTIDRVIRTLSSRSESISGITLLPGCSNESRLRFSTTDEYHRGIVAWPSTNLAQGIRFLSRKHWPVSLTSRSRSASRSRTFIFSVNSPSGTLTSVFSTIVAMSKKNKASAVTFREEEKPILSPTKEIDSASEKAR